MHLLWRVRAKAFSSPLGSLSPTVANCWYSSTTNSTGRQYRSRFHSSCIRAGRSSRVDSHACLSITPSVRARLGFSPAGMFSARIFPDSIRS